MKRLSILWAVGASFLVVGGLVIAALPFQLLGLGGQLAVDAACLFGPLAGGLVAALASQRGLIGEVGLGALFALLFALAIVLLIAQADAIASLADTATVRAGALFCVGSMVGAGLGHRAGRTWLGGERIKAPLFWFLVGGLTSLAGIAIAGSLAVQVVTDSVALGFISMAVGPAFGGVVAQLMAPARSRKGIALGCAVVPMLFALADVPDSLQALGAFPVLWFCGWIGAVIGSKLHRPDEPDSPVPRAHIES